MRIFTTLLALAITCTSTLTLASNSPLTNDYDSFPASNVCYQFSGNFDAQPNLAKIWGGVYTQQEVKIQCAIPVRANQDIHRVIITTQEYGPIPDCNLTVIHGSGLGVTYDMVHTQPTSGHNTHHYDSLGVLAATSVNNMSLNNIAITCQPFKQWGSVYFGILQARVEYN